MKITKPSESPPETETIHTNVTKVGHTSGSEKDKKWTCTYI